MKKSIGILIVLSLLISTFLLGVATAEELKTIGVDLYYRRDEYYVDLESTFTTYGAEKGYNIVIQDADGDVTKQIQQIEDFITAGVDAIAIAATDPDALVDVLDRAVDANIPVVCFDGGANSKKISTKVIFDYAKNGQLTGEWAVNYIKENLADKDVVKIAILDFPPSPVVSQPMADAFQACVETLPNVKIVARQDGKANRTDSMAAAENILTANPDLDIFYGINFDTGAGALAAVQAANSDAIIICAGWASEGFEKLEANDKNLKVMCSNVPVTQAIDTIDALTAIFNGEELPAETISMPTLLDATTINDFDWESVVAARVN